MGQTLATPLTSQWIQYLEHSDDLQIAAAEMQGQRMSMEDQTSIILGQEHSFFGVFDGHGGPETSKRLGNAFGRRVLALDEPMDRLFLDRCCVDFDAHLAKEHQTNAMLDLDGDGSTALFAVMNHETNYIHVCNAGDCRAIIVRADGTLSVVTTDHTPGLESEGERIRSAGGYVQVQMHGNRRISRINGQLSVSRGFGDFQYKRAKDKTVAEQRVSCMPEHFTIHLDPGDSLFMACDGVYDELSNEAIAEFITQGLGNIQNPAASASASVKVKMDMDMDMDVDVDMDMTDIKAREDDPEAQAQAFLRKELAEFEKTLPPDPPRTPRQVTSLDQLVSALLLHVVVDRGSSDNTSALLIHRAVSKKPTGFGFGEQRRYYQEPLRSTMLKSRIHVGDKKREWNRAYNKFKTRVADAGNRTTYKQ